MSARGKSPTQRGTAPSRARTSDPDFSDDIPTKHYDSKNGKPGTPAPQPPIVAVSAKAPEKAPPQKIITISMKTPAHPELAPVKVPEREMPHMKLRQMSEVSRAQIPLNLGNLAPPYDPSEARKRTMKEYVVWGSLAVMIACAIALVVWFAAT